MPLENCAVVQSLSEKHWVLKTVKKGLRDGIFATPLVSDIFRQHWKFLSRLGACRGVFSSYLGAERAAAEWAPVGYNSDLVFGPEILGDYRSEIRRRDYPIVLWLAAVLNEASKVLVVGGSDG